MHYWLIRRIKNKAIYAREGLLLKLCRDVVSCIGYWLRTHPSGAVSLSNNKTSSLWASKRRPLDLYVTVSATAGLSFAVPVRHSTPSDMLLQMRSSHRAVLQKIDLHPPKHRSRRSHRSAFARQRPITSANLLGLGVLRWQLLQH